MSIKEFIEKAIEGGWHLEDEEYTYEGWTVQQLMGECLHQILLDPEAWKAVGKVEGWPENAAGSMIIVNTGESGWRVKMHDMIDALAEGKTIEQYLETL